MDCGTQPEIDLISLRGASLAEFAHTVCLSYLSDNTASGKQIFDHAIQYCGKFFVPAGLRLVSVSSSTGLGGFDIGNVKTRRGPAQAVLDWLCEFNGTGPVQVMNQETVLIADRFGVIGSIRINRAFLAAQSSARPKSSATEKTLALGSPPT